MRYLVIMLVSCATTATPTVTSTTTQEAPHVELAEVVVTEAEGVRLHSLVSPEMASFVTAHVIETESSLVVVDTQLFVTHAEQLRALCEQLGKPIDRVIVTHGHPDHYFGIRTFSDVPIQAFPDVRVKIGQRLRGHWSMHRRMEGDLIAEEILEPTEDLAEGEFTVDGVRIQVERVVDGEDVVQAVLWLPDARVLILQDLGSHNVHAFFGTGPVQPWQQTLQRYMEREPVAVLSGHGPPGDGSVLQETYDYLASVGEAAARAETKEALIADVMERFPNRGGPFLVEVSALIIFRDRARD